MKKIITMALFLIGVACHAETKNYCVADSKAASEISELTFYAGPPENLEELKPGDTHDGKNKYVTTYKNFDLYKPDRIYVMCRRGDDKVVEKIDAKFTECKMEVLKKTEKTIFSCH